MTTTPETNIFNTINKVGRELKKMVLDVELIEILDEELNTIATYLQVNKQQALIFSVLFRLNLNDEQNGIGFKEISHYLDVPLVELMIVQKDIDILTERRLIQKERTRTRSKMRCMFFVYSINQVLIDAILSNASLPDLSKIELMNVYEFVDNVSKMVEMRNREMVDTYDLIELVDNTENKNSHLGIIGKLQSTGIDLIERIIFYNLLDNLAKLNNSTKLESIVTALFNDVREKLEAINMLRDNKARLSEIGYIEIDGGDFISECTISLTDKAIEFALGEDASLFTKKVKSDNLIYSEQMVGKEMFFDDELQRQLTFINESLKFDNFKNIQNRLKDKGMSTGIVILLYGEPGTGKTQTAYNIAKKSIDGNGNGRPIMQVDISNTRSKWYGQTEKMVKSLFIEYDNLCAKNEHIPILLINECDAIISKRIDNADSSSTSQTSHTVQNILLEQLEVFRGIMILTSNMTSYDKAFERRFHYKIKFTSPSNEVTQKIWKLKIPSIVDEDAKILSEKFQFSGGEIDNVTRKISMNEILNGITPDIHQIIDYCNNEKFTNQHTNRIGY